MVERSVCQRNPGGSRRPGMDLELADVVRRFSPAYRAQYGGQMMPSQSRALSDIAACCTKELGGRLYRCRDCCDTFWRFHCCRNRACPKCHGPQIREWLAKREAELLPCDYFHVVATVPSELRDVFRCHQKLLYGLLMRVSAAAVQELCAQKRHLGALPGILSVLHTWNGDLRYHVHVHMLITAGGITADGRHFRLSRGKFLVPVAVLSRKIAAKFREAMQREVPLLYAEVPGNVWQREWVSFSKHYGQGNDAVLKYLSRYVFRTAISNARILAMDETHVVFRSKDRNSGSWRRIRLPGVEFLRRFLQHVLPRGFHRVRYYGLWHSSRRALAHRAWLLLILQTPSPSDSKLRFSDWVESLDQPTGQQDGLTEPSGVQDNDSPCCPHCGSRRTRFLAEWPRFGIP